jgi:hypothetical protein
MSPLQHLEVIREINSNAPTDSLRAEHIAAVTAELEKLQGELEGAEKTEVEKLSPSVDRRLAEVEKKPGAEAIEGHLRRLQSTLNRKGFQPELHPISERMADGEPKKLAEQAENAVLHPTVKGLKYTEQMIREHPQAVAILGVTLFTALVTMGDKIKEFFRGIGNAIAWPFRKIWEHKGKLAAIAATVGGAYWFSKQNAEGAETKRAEEGKKPDTPSPAVGAEAEEKKPAAPAAPAKPDEKREPDAAPEFNKLKEGTVLLGAGAQPGPLTAEINGTRKHVEVSVRNQVLQVRLNGKTYRILRDGIGRDLGKKVKKAVMKDDGTIDITNDSFLVPRVSVSKAELLSVIAQIDQGKRRIRISHSSALSVTESTLIIEEVR